MQTKMSYIAVKNPQEITEGFLNKARMILTMFLGTISWCLSHS